DVLELPEASRQAVDRLPAVERALDESPRRLHAVERGRGQLQLDLLAAQHRGELVERERASVEGQGPQAGGILMFGARRRSRVSQSPSCGTRTAESSRFVRQPPKWDG